MFPTITFPDVTGILSSESILETGMLLVLEGPLGNSTCSIFQIYH